MALGVPEEGEAAVRWRMALHKEAAIQEEMAGALGWGGGVMVTGEDLLSQASWVARPGVQGLPPVQSARQWASNRGAVLTGALWVGQEGGCPPAGKERLHKTVVRERYLQAQKERKEAAETGTMTEAMLFEELAAFPREWGNVGAVPEAVLLWMRMRGCDPLHVAVAAKRLGREGRRIFVAWWKAREQRWWRSTRNGRRGWRARKGE